MFLWEGEALWLIHPRENHTNGLRQGGPVSAQCRSPVPPCGSLRDTPVAREPPDAREARTTVGIVLACHPGALSPRETHENGRENARPRRRTRGLREKWPVRSPGGAVEAHRRQLIDFASGRRARVERE